MASLMEWSLVETIPGTTKRKRFYFLNVIQRGQTIERLQKTSSIAVHKENIEKMKQKYQTTRFVTITNEKINLNYSELRFKA